MSISRSDIAFLFDVDNTLLDNDRVIADLQSHLDKEVGVERAQHYWRLFEQLRHELGCGLSRCLATIPRRVPA